MPTYRAAPPAAKLIRRLPVQWGGLLGPAAVALLCFVVIGNLLGGNMFIPVLDRPGVAAGISALTLALVAVIGLLTLENRFNWLTLPITVMLALLLWDLLSMSFSTVHFVLKDYIQVMIAALVFVGIAVAARQERWRGAILLSLAVCIVFGGLICLWEFFLSPNFFSTAPGRAAGLYQNPNYASMALSGLLVFHLASMGRKPGTWKQIVLYIGLCGVLATVSRTGVIVVSLILGYWTWHLYGRKNLIIFVTVLSSTGALLFALLIQMRNSLNLSMDALTRVDSLLGGFGVTDFSQARGGVAETSWTLLRENIWGHGAGTTLSLPQGAHNMYLSLAVDHGVVISGVYLALWFWLGWGAFRSGGSLMSRLFWLWLGVWNVASHNMFAPVCLGILALGLAFGAGALPARGYPQPLHRRSAWMAHPRFTSNLRALPEALTASPGGGPKRQGSAGAGPARRAGLGSPSA